MIANLLNKQYGQGTALLASEITPPKKLTSGSLSLDVILGGGWPCNQWSELRGLRSAGKTALMLKSIAANQKVDPDFHALWIAAETYDVGQAAALGVDNSRVTVVPTQQMELAFQTMIDAADSKEVDLCVLDSYPALVADEEAGKAMDEFTTAVGARNMNKFVRKAGLATSRAANGSERQMAGVIINQYRQKIGGYAPRGATPLTTPGGEGKDYFYYIILKISRDEWIEEKIPGQKDAVAVGQTIKLLTEKNKAAPPRQLVTLDFYFRNAPTLGFKRGEFDTALDYFTVASLFEIINKKGGWYYYQDNRWQGKQAVLDSLREDITLRNELAEDVMTAISLPDVSDKLISSEVEDFVTDEPSETQ